MYVVLRRAQLTHLSADQYPNSLLVTHISGQFPNGDITQRYLQLDNMLNYQEASRSLPSTDASPRFFDPNHYFNQPIQPPNM